MDQAKTGRFIADQRKALGLTQRQLAQQLSISDKTVSKWERGGGLPEVGLMLPLCGELGISVNELLAGRRVEEKEYKEQAEANMMDLVRQNQENKKRMALSVICGSVTVVAVCALTIIASYLPLPAAARVAVLALALVTAVAGIGGAAVLDAGAGWFQCPECGELFVPTMAEYVKGYHTFTRRKLTCPKCGKRSMCRHRVVRPGRDQAD